ncbi:MAG: hypothetical protein IPG28_07915 [Betaproteobacteria bacterium]|nr:hypothetical protein [Betaproteobacteria bacterium]
MSPEEFIVHVFPRSFFESMATSVIGNGIATAVVAKWEGQLGPTPTTA